jgi:uncharacterized protein
MKIRRLLRILHRDLGYFIVGMTIVYCLSGIYLNHRHDFNPDYRIMSEEITASPVPADTYDKQAILDLLGQFEIKSVYKKHYITNQGNVKVFIENGEVVIDPENGTAYMTYLKKRPLIFEMNVLHRATIGTGWKFVSDGMAVVLLFVAVSGLFLLKGKRGFGAWGWIWTIAGIAVPLFFVLMYI